MKIHDASSDADGILQIQKNDPITPVEWKNISFALLRVHWKDKKVSVTFPDVPWPAILTSSLLNELLDIVFREYDWLNFH